MEYPKLTKVTPRQDYELELEFDNGEKRLFDFAYNLNHPFYAQLKDIKYFCKVQVVDGEILWASGQDFCPHTLYQKSMQHA
ncbi:MAG: DUF2442 domain-containing protein [Oscillospiraceae bacterium]|nr:DUF2442 domain-containing protein [Oscillospiraceae bacterium]